MTSKPDFVAHNHGSVWTIVAVSESAKLFAEEHFGVEAWQGNPGNFTTDHRVAYQLCSELLADGFIVQGR